MEKKNKRKQKQRQLENTYRKFFRETKKRANIWRFNCFMEESKLRPISLLEPSSSHYYNLIIHVIFFREIEK